MSDLKKIGDSAKNSSDLKHIRSLTGEGSHSSVAGDSFFFKLNTERLIRTLQVFGSLPKAPTPGQFQAFSRNSPHASANRAKFRNTQTESWERWRIKKAEPLRLTVSHKQIELETTFRPSTKLQGFMRTNMNVLGEVNNIAIGETRSVIVDLTRIQLVAAAFPGASISFKFSEKEEEYRITQGDTDLVFSLMSNSDFHVLQPGILDKSSDLFVDIEIINKALRYTTTLSRADKKEKVKKHLAIHSGSAIGGGSELLAFFESPCLQDLDLAIPLSAASSLMHAFRQLEPKETIYAADGEYRLIRDKTTSILFVTDSWDTQGFNNVVQRQTLNKIIVSRGKLLDGLILLKVVRSLVDRNASLMTRIAEFAAKRTGTLPAVGLEEEPHDGRRVLVKVIGEGSNANISLSIVDPSGRGRGTMDPVPCEHVRGSDVEGQLMNIEMFVDLLHWLRAVDSTTEDKIELSVAFMNGIPLTLSVEDHKASIPNSSERQRARCFIGIRRSDRVRPTRRN